MARTNLDSMSYRDLLELQQRVEVAIEERKLAEREEVRRKIEALALDSGFDVDEVVGKARSSKKGGKVPPKYRNPKNPAETWTGRGRQPRWLVAEIGRGKKIDSFLIRQ